MVATARSMDEETSSATTLLNNHDNNYNNSSSTTTTTTDLIERGTSPLSDNQEKSLALLPIIPCILSISGALLMIYRIRCKDQRRSSSSRTTTPYQRILLGMSVMGVLAVASFGMQPFLLPQHSSNRVWTRGNNASCAFSGFMFQLSISMVFYYSSLSFYFLAVVRFGLSDEAFAKRFEPFLHGLSLGFPLVTATIGAALGVYGEHDLSPMCWVSNYPRGCEENPDETCKSPLVGWIFGGGVMVLALVTILLNNVLIFCHVHKEASLSHATSFARAQQQYRHDNNGNNNNPPYPPHDGCDGLTVTPTTTPVPRTTTSSTRPPRNPKVRAVAIQGAMYVATGIICYLPTVLLRAMEAMQSDESGGSSEGRLYPIFVLQALFLPSQNSIIALIFVHPRYVKCRSICPHKSRLWALLYAALGGNIPRTSASSRRAITTCVPNGTRAAAAQVSIVRKKSQKPTAPSTLGFDLRQQAQKDDDDGDKESVTHRTQDYEDAAQSYCFAVEE